MESMVRKVAKAVEAALLDQAGNDSPNIDCVTIARAAIEAMREPSDAMISDGAFQIFRGERITEDDLAAAKRVWRGMTAAALNEQVSA